MEAVGQLTGGLAHDFNNMLTGIVGSLSLVKTRCERGDLDQVPKYIHLALEAARKAAVLTHRLLAFSRQQTLDLKPTRVNALVEGMTELISRTLGPEISIATRLDEALWLTKSDPHQLENALLNLCINARDAMPGGGTLMIATKNEHLLPQEAANFNEGKSGDYITLSVIDTGSGMPPDIVTRVFEPFFTTKPIGEGTGLGLSMIYGFLQQSGGNIRIESEVGKGTAVRLYLPRYDGLEEADTIEPSTGAPRLFQKATVLIVDDEPTVRSIVGDALTDIGLTIFEAENAESALQILRTTPSISLLITDVGMPGMNGHQLASAARQQNSSLKVLFITGYEKNSRSYRDSLEHGMQVITKPFELDALAHRVQSMILAE